MHNPFARYSVLFLGIAACILVMLPVLPFLASPRGVAGPTCTDAVHPATAALALGLGSAVCCAIACVVGRLINAAVGLFVLGCGLAVISGQSGTILDAAFDGDSLLPIAFETIAWSGAVLLMSAIVFRVSGPLLDLPARTKGGAFIHEVFNSDAGRALAAGLLAVAVMYLLSCTELKGQAIGAAVVGYTRLCDWNCATLYGLHPEGATGSGGGATWASWLVDGHARGHCRWHPDWNSHGSGVDQAR
jgi:hypothetical protein